MITRKKRYKNNSEKTKMIVSMIAAGTIIATSTTRVFGEADVSTLLNNWYQSKVSEAKNKITQDAAIKTEVEKAKLIEQIRTDIEASSSEIVRYSEQKSAEVQLAIEKKRKELEDEMIQANKEEKDEVKDEIDQSTKEQIEEIKKDKDDKKSEDDKDDSKHDDKESKEDPKKEEDQSKDDSDKENPKNEDETPKDDPKKDKN